MGAATVYDLHIHGSRQGSMQSAYRKRISEVQFPEEAQCTLYVHTLKQLEIEKNLRPYFCYKDIYIYI